MGNGSDRPTHRRVQMTASITALALGFIAREYAGRPNAAKTLARIARTSHRTTERWLAGKAVPTGENFMAMLVECEGFADTIFAAVQREKSNRGK